MRDTVAMLNRRHLLRSLASGLLVHQGVQAAEGAGEPFRIAYFETYSPLSFVEAQQLKGILVDVLDAVIAGELQQPCVHQGYPWPRAQQLVELGQQDAMCTIATAARLQYAVAAEETVVESPTCIFGLRSNSRMQELSGANSLAELRSLNPKVLSYSANGWAKAKLEGFDVVWGNDFMSALRMLVAGRGDIMIENALTMGFSLRRLAGGERVAMLPNRMDTAHFQLLVSKRSRHLALLPRFSSALKRYKATPAYAAVFAKYGVPLAPS